MQDPLIVNGTRVFRPWEYTVLRSYLKPDQQIVADTLLLTGMRYEELLRFRHNPNWLDEDSATVHLPSWAMQKGRKLSRNVQTERWVRLSIRGKGVVPNLFRVEMPRRVAFDQMLKRKALKASISREDFVADNISQKTFRKTLASWLRIYYPSALDHIFLSLGHSRITELRHYLGIPFSDRDKQEMREWVEGWI
jgi:hypothetical protein